MFKQELINKYIKNQIKISFDPKSLNDSYEMIINWYEKKWENILTEIIVDVYKIIDEEKNKELDQFIEKFKLKIYNNKRFYKHK